VDSPDPTDSSVHEPTKLTSQPIHKDLEAAAAAENNEDVPRLLSGNSDGEKGQTLLGTGDFPDPELMPRWNTVKIHQTDFFIDPNVVMKDCP
jgi:hypothetical protein